MCNITSEHITYGLILRTWIPMGVSCKKSDVFFHGLLQRAMVNVTYHNIPIVIFRYITRFIVQAKPLFVVLLTVSAVPPCYIRLPTCTIADDVK